MLEDLYYTCRIDMNMQFWYVDFTAKSFAVIILIYYRFTKEKDLQYDFFFRLSGMNLFNLYEICSDIKYLLWKVSDFDIFDYSLMMQNLVGFPFSFSCFRHESRWGFFLPKKLVLSHRHLILYIFLKIKNIFP